MFGAPNSRRSVPGKTHTGGEIEDEKKFLASLAVTLSWFAMAALRLV
jgi:hypothetical protein